jgi:DNA polymerase-3 subunit gamma/tau
MNYRTSRNKRLLVELTLIELSQMNDGDTDDGGGHGPKILKPIFNRATTANKPEKQDETGTRTATTSSSQADTSIVATKTPKTDDADRKSAVNPAKASADIQSVPNVMQGRPAELQNRAEKGGSLGKMFNRSRQAIVEDTRPIGATDTSTQRRIHGTTEATPRQEAPMVITDEMLTKAWTSFALSLPENERALSDRMKIMPPKMSGEDAFTISVDNQMAAELFERESRRICKGMEEDLYGRNLKMLVTVNKVIVERHTSDKGKQFEILKNKNPLIEKLRKELDLELAR